MPVFRFCKVDAAKIKPLTISETPNNVIIRAQNANHMVVVIVAFKNVFIR